jgi:site-specific DNA recombinase
MWMGGVPLLGYDVRERRLVANPGEAETVRYIHQRYLELGCVRQLSRELAERSTVSKIRVSRKGIKSGGCRFSRGALYELLSNPLHIGEIRHRGTRYPGQHEAIVPRELWEEVQQHLRNKAARGRQSATSAIAHPLAGKIFDADGESLYAQGAAKAGRRYRYYVSRCLVHGTASDDRKGWRLAAPELERAVASAAQQILRDRAGVLEVIERSQLQSPNLSGTLDANSALFRRLQNEADARACMAELVDRIELHDDGIRVTLKIQVPCSHAGVRISSILGLSRFVPLMMKRRGVEKRIVIAAGDDPPRKVDQALLKAVARGRQWADDLLAGRMESVAAIATRDGVLPNYVRRLTRLAFLAPRIVEAIVAGHHPPELSAKDLTERIDLPLLWGEQERAVRISWSAQTTGSILLRIFVHRPKFQTVAPNLQTEIFAANCAAPIERRNSPRP